VGIDPFRESSVGIGPFREFGQPAPIGAATVADVGWPQLPQ
jgi:hypothetical protein